MFTQYVSLEDAQVRSQQVFHEVIKKINSMCYTEHVINEQFRTRVIDILNNTSITWRKMGFTSAGKTIKRGGMFPEYHIEMNINYLYSKDAERFVKYTMIHELVHVIADVYNGSWGHNSTFYRFDVMFGGRGTRCCDYLTPDNKPKDNKISFLCTHCGAKITLTPYMIQKCKTGKYVCSTCKTNIKEILKFYNF